MKLMIVKLIKQFKKKKSFNLLILSTQKISKKINNKKEKKTM